MKEIKYVILMVCCALPAYGASDERICKEINLEPLEQGLNYEMRWVNGIALELLGELYFGNNIHWLEDGGWRTGSRYYRTSRMDEHGKQRIHLKEARYEYDPECDSGGRLLHYIRSRVTNPESKPKIKENRYDNAWPEKIPAEAGIETSGLGSVATESVYIADCSIVPDGTLKGASDYSVLDIFMQYMKNTFEEEKDINKSAELVNNPG